jgi:hypothetical protein
MSFLIFSHHLVSAEERLRILNCSAIIGSSIIMEITYEIDKPYFVIDELTDGELMYNYEDHVLLIYYYPRGNYVRIANEEVIWPVKVRRINPDEAFVLRLNFKKIIDKFSTENITEIKLFICDNLFVLQNNEYPFLLFPRDFLTRKKLYSDIIIIRKNKNTGMFRIWHVTEAEVPTYSDGPELEK